MTRRNHCLLPWPSDRGAGIGYQWSYDNFFDGIDSETEVVCDFEEIDGLEACFNCEANFNWIMDGNFFDGINNCATVDSKATQECNKNKGSRCGKGKPQSVILSNLQPPGEDGEDMEKTEVACDFEEIDVLDCPPMDEAYFKCKANFNCMMDGINNCATVDSKATKECNKNKGSQCRKGKPQCLIVHNLQPICKGKELRKVSKMQNKAACDKRKELKKVVDLYSETKTQNKVACGKGKELKNVVDLYSKKRVADANVDKHYNLKLEFTKRKLQEDYEKCKKVRKIQLMGHSDLRKPEDTKARSKAVRSFPKRICKPTTVKQRVSQKLRAMGKKKVC